MRFKIPKRYENQQSNDSLFLRIERDSFRARSRAGQISPRRACLWNAWLDLRYARKRAHATRRLGRGRHGLLLRSPDVVDYPRPKFSALGQRHRVFNRENFWGKSFGLVQLILQSFPRFFSAGTFF